ncbi:Protein kinase binding [Dermatophagoides pteronyssinus]|uniref:Protein kinase binding n=1 Tax=Dermatophagoides pteronyssinus TaxID=6956 RepID=A0ABQ8J0W5_DERPT|nr:Protein kinase binding [Dermatophagoides pteronyssinus]
MEAQKRPLAANVVNIRCGGVVGQMDGLLKNSLPKNDPKLLKRGRDSPPNLLQKKKKNFGVAGGAAIKNDENAYDPTRTIETKIKNIKISQKNDLPLKPLMINNNNKKQQNELKIVMQLDKNHHTAATTKPNVEKQQQPSKTVADDDKKHRIDPKDYYEPPKNLPADIIDYDRTQLENINSEPIYAFEIFEYLREKEQTTRCVKYMHQQKEISSRMRTILIDWLVEVQQTFELNHETLYHAIKIMDHFLMLSQIKRTRLQLLGIVSMFIAAKCDERIYPIIEDFLYITDNSYVRDDIIKMEIEILQVLQFNLNYPLSYSFLRRFARVSSQTLETLTLSRFILETSLMDYTFIDELDSKMAAASLLLALRMKHLQWNKTLDFYTGYREQDLIELAKRLNQLIKPVNNRQQESIRNKYSDSVFFGVANIRPLDDI